MHLAQHDAIRTGEAGVDILDAQVIFLHCAFDDMLRIGVLPKIRFHQRFLQPLLDVGLLIRSLDARRKRISVNAERICAERTRPFSTISVQAALLVFLPASASARLIASDTHGSWHVRRGRILR